MSPLGVRGWGRGAGGAELVGGCSGESIGAAVGGGWSWKAALHTPFPSSIPPPHSYGGVPPHLTLMAAYVCMYCSDELSREHCLKLSSSIQSPSQLSGRVLRLGRCSDEFSRLVQRPHPPASPSRRVWPRLWFLARPSSCTRTTPSTPSGPTTWRCSSCKQAPLLPRCALRGVEAEGQAGCHSNASAAGEPSSRRGVCVYAEYQWESRGSLSGPLTVMRKEGHQISLLFLHFPLPPR